MVDVTAATAAGKDSAAGDERRPPIRSMPVSNRSRIRGLHRSVRWSSPRSALSRSCVRQTPRSRQSAVHADAEVQLPRERAARARSTRAGTCPPGIRSICSWSIWLAVTAAYRLTTAAAVSAPRHDRASAARCQTPAAGAAASGWGPRRRSSATTLVRGRDKSHAGRGTGNRISSADQGNGGSYTSRSVPHVKVAGQIAGQPIATTYSPPLNLALGTPQFLCGYIGDRHRRRVRARAPRSRG